MKILTTLKSRLYSDFMAKVTNKNFHCPVCNNAINNFERLPDHYFKQFDNFQFIHSIFQFETLNIIDYSCPACRANDRDRLNALYFQFIYPVQDTKIYLLDIAPSLSFKKYLIRKFPDILYRSADLMMEGVDDRIDLTNMHIYKDETFDFFICSHVLEHINEDRKALKELYRIVKTGGQGILMVPILLSLSEDFEKSDVNSDEDRWRYYGQNDHVRMYSKRGFVSKLKDAGFSVTEYNKESFPDGIFDKSGIHPRSVLYIVNK